MRRLFLFTVIIAFAINECAAQINHVSLGYGSIEFPSIQIDADNKFGYDAHEADPTKGGVAYLSLGFDNLSSDIIKGGATVLIGGDSRITYGGENYGAGLAGVALFGEMNLIKKSDFLRFRFQAGIVGIHTYEKRGNTLAEYGMMDPQANLPELKKTNIQPWGQIGIGISGVEIMYSPMAKSVTVGFRLFKG